MMPKPRSVGGVQQGKREGEARLLERLLSRRFGPLSDEVKERLQTASSSGNYADTARF